MEDSKKLAELFKMLVDNKKKEETKKFNEKRKLLQTKKRIGQTKGLESVSKRIREKKEVKGKHKRRKRTSVDGEKPHSHLYSRGDTHTSVTNGHKHKISKDNKRALAGKTGHSHKLKNPY